MSRTYSKRDPKGRAADKASQQAARQQFHQRRQDYELSRATDSQLTMDRDTPVRQQPATAALQQSAGSHNLLNLANIDNAFFNQQQQQRAEQQQLYQKQQQQQQQQSLASSARPAGSPSSTTSTECLNLDPRVSMSASSSSGGSSGGASSSAGSGNSHLVRQAHLAGSTDQPNPHLQQPQNLHLHHQLQQQQQHHMMMTSTTMMMHHSDTTDDIQSLTSQLNLCMTSSSSSAHHHHQSTSTSLATIQHHHHHHHHNQPTSIASSLDQQSDTGAPQLPAPFVQGHGHYFTKKTFHKPTYCHYCADMLWGLIGQGYICEVCNFVVHERCMKQVVSCCSTVSSSTIKNPMPHCWRETHAKRKFCNVCRKKIEADTAGQPAAIRCNVCEYCCHAECQEFSISDCRECATYVPDSDLKDASQQHHWREGNLPQNSAKCHWCKKSCFSAECLTGMRCEWCQITMHATCFKQAPRECTFGCLQSIMLPPYCVSIPRTDVPMETIIGVQNRYLMSAGAGGSLAGGGGTAGSMGGPLGQAASSMGGPMTGSALSASKRDNLSPRSTSEDFCQATGQQQEDLISRDKDEETLRLYDGNNAIKKRTFRLISVHKSSNREALIAACLRALYIHDDVSHYALFDINEEEREILEELPLVNLAAKREKLFRPAAILLRYRPADPNTGSIKVYPGRLNVSEITYCQVPVTNDSSVDDIMLQALDKFRLRSNELSRYRLVEVSLDKGGSVHERTMDNQECPWEIIKNIARESVRQKENTRFYLQQQDEVYCSSVAIFVGNFPPNLSQKQYEFMLMKHLGKPYKFKQMNPIYYEYGSCIITYDNADIAVKAFYMLRECTIKHGEETKSLTVLLLPNIVPEMIPEGVRPLLVFVNVKSGGCQGLDLITSFRRLLNPYQVYDLENGGPLPGLYVFRKIRDYKILVSGGDGSVGWVLQCLDNVGQDSVCQSPPCAIIPLGTGNDLARVLCWGSGYTGAEDPMSFLKDIIDAEEVVLDRWTVVFHSDEAASKQDMPGAIGASGQGATGAEDNAAIFVMNNYLGIGLDADLCLGFHNAREENPDKFNSRLHNKGVYVKQAIRKMVNRSSWNNLSKAVRLEVDGKTIAVPNIEGIIILNILSWGSGANPWGFEQEDRFAKPTHYDGMLEVVGLTGIVHMGQIQSGLSRALRIAQGSRIKLRLNTEVPIQVDGEPWIQPACEVNILKSALKATMLRKIKMKRRNTEPSINHELERVSVGSSEKSSSTTTTSCSGGDRPEDRE